MERQDIHVRPCLACRAPHALSNHNVEGLRVDDINAFMDALLSGLNPAQKDAVTSQSSVLQVLAPPGSGKTKTLTARVAYLIAHHGFLPWNIVVCTFTIKAAREMRERICGLVGEKTAAKLILGTFHSVARRYLVSYGHKIGIEKNFGIADTADTLSMLKRIVKRLNSPMDPKVARSRISSHKARNLTSEQSSSKTKSVEQQQFVEIFAAYEETMKAENLLDYDDLLLRCVELLRRFPACVSNVDAVLIDEFQDTNNVQYDLMGYMAQEKNRITIVGDPDQSIYGFRAAEIKNLRRMQTQWPDTVVINLEENYRSSGCILYSASKIIEQDTSRPEKRLLATHCVGERPVFRKLPSAFAEAKWIVTEIQRAHILSGRMLAYNDFAILLRSASISQNIERALGKAGIPYRMVGGHRFFDRKEIKIVLDYLRVVNLPDHNDALIRIINVPSRKVGDLTCRKLLLEAEEKKTTLWKLILGASQGTSRPNTDISSQAQKGIHAFVGIILTSRKKLESMEEQGGTLIDLVSHILKKLSFEDYLKKTHPEDHEERWANVQELVAQATDMTTALGDGEAANEDALPVVEGIEQRQGSSAAEALARFLSNVALSTELEKEDGESSSQVTISTIHAAKGLEWPVVFIPAAYEGSIPHSRSDDNDEERRLLYVGMTRAKALLYISCPVKNSQKEETTISSFLKSTDDMSMQAPSFRFTVVQDIARILRRDCPTDAVLASMQDQVDRLEDDLWPLDGENIDPEDSYWSSVQTAYQPGFASNKRKLDDRVAVTTTNVSVTMQQNQSYSVSSTTVSSGFVSAGRHLKRLKEEEEVKQVEKAVVRSISNTLNQGAAVKPTLKKQGSMNQGSITSFFNKPKAASKDTQFGYHLPRASTNNAFQPPRTAVRNNSQCTGLMLPQESNVSVDTRRIRDVPMGNKPRKRTNEDTDTKRYVLMSSSPVKPDDVEARLDENTRERSPCKPKMVSKMHDNGSLLNGFRPASTFHQTSVGQIANTAPLRRTLGVKRSMNGWSDRMARQ